MFMAIDFVTNLSFTKCLVFVILYLQLFHQNVNKYQIVIGCCEVKFYDQFINLFSWTIKSLHGINNIQWLKIDVNVKCYQVLYIEY